MRKMYSVIFIPLLVILFLMKENAHAQTGDIVPLTGKVKDEKGEPLPGVSINVKGTQVGTVTDSSGSFVINAPQGSETLVFEFLGLDTKEVAIAGQNNFDVRMSETTSSLNEVVVIGYGAVRRAEVTSSISSVTDKDIKNLPVAGVDQAIQGKVAGVTVTTNGGQPGGGVSVRVRGITSVNGTEPLYVIDGVPVSETQKTNYNSGGANAAQTVQSPLANINPADIASIDILKDASAQAIYGSRAANGVVIITTKRGKAGDSKISYDFYTGVAELRKKIDMMDLSEFATYQNQILREKAIVDSNLSTFVPIGEFRDPSVLGKGSDWQDALFQRGITTQHQLSFSGGVNKTTYYTSLNYFDQTGIVIGSGISRYSLRLNLDQQIKDWFKIGINATLTRSNQKVSLTNGATTPISIAVSNSPAAPIFSNGQFSPLIRLGGYQFGSNSNPIALSTLRDIRNIVARALFNVYGEVALHKSVTFRSQLSVDYNINDRKFYEPQVFNGSIPIIPVSSINISRGIGSFYSITNYLNFNHTLGKHYVSFQVGQEAWVSKWDDVGASRRDLNLNFQSIAAGGTVGQTTSGSLSEQAMSSYFGRAGYVFDNRYSLNLSIRRDGSSYFGKDRRYGYFPAASLGWTATNERFLKDIPVITYLKVRVGGGSVGRGVTTYANAYTSGLRQETGAFGAGSWPSNVPNSKLGWESVATYNAGIDATILKRIEITLDIYRKNTTNMLLSSNLPAYTGIGTNWDDIQAPITNAGKMQNNGIDIAVTSYNIQKNLFTWKTTLNFTHYKNILKELNAGTKSISYSTFDALNAERVVTRSVINEPVGMFYGYIADGLYRSVEEIRNGAYNRSLQVQPKGVWLGDVKYRDISGPEGKPDGNINSYDVVAIGNPNPSFTFGLTNTLTYRDFDFTLFLQGSYGADILNFTRLQTEGARQSFQNQTVRVLNDRYTESNPNGSLPRYVDWHDDNLALSSRFIEDGSYLRVQTVSVGYNLPKTWISKVKLSAARVYVLGQNLHTFTKYSGLDPELGSFNNNALFSNVDNGNYPNPRTYTIGANITF